MIDGRGTYRWRDGRVYEGEFKADKMDGRCTVRLPTVLCLRESSRRKRRMGTARSDLQTAVCSKVSAKVRWMGPDNQSC